MKHILIPTDFSNNAKHAIIFGLAMALDLKASVTFFHMTSLLVPTSAPLGHYEKQVAHNIELKTAELKAHTKEFYEVLGIVEQELPTNYVVVDGLAFADQVAAYVHKNHTDLIIMGTKGETGVESIIFGSNTSNLIAKSECAVLAIPTDYHYSKVKRIAFATTLEHVEKDIAEFIEIVKNFKASLELVYIYPTFPPNIDIATFDNDGFIEKLSKKFNYDKINLHFVHTNNDNEVVEGMNLFVTAYKPSLLVMNTHKRNLFDRFFNSSITEEVAMKTKLPLLALKSTK